MARRILYFLLGIAFTIAALAYLILWDSYRNFKIAEQADRFLQAQFQPAEKKVIQPEDLIGKWQGKESFGTVFTITRRADGTFSKVTDSRNSDAAQKPYFVKSKGYWAFSGSTYALYYTQSSDPSRVGQPPDIFNLTDFSSNSFEYSVEEGNGCREQKD